MLSGTTARDGPRGRQCFHPRVVGNALSVGRQAGPSLPADRLARWNDRFLRRLYPQEVVEATIRSGYAFHTLPAAWAEVLGRFDADAMRHVKVPVLILNGERDPVFRAGEADFARAHPHARVELIPRARHLANFDDPDAFTDAVRRFARRLPAVG